ncbi:hypothetical protein OSJ57_13340 [Sphingomonas sp. HH69]
MRKIFNNLANIIAIASAVGFATASPRLLADTQADQTFHIEAQNLADALRALGTQLGREVMFQPALSTAEQKSAIRRRKTRPSCYMPGGVA